MKLAILVPAYNHIEPETDMALRVLERQGIWVWRCFGISAIDQARIMMAGKALEKGYDALLWIDADTGFEPSMVEKIIAHKVDVVGGVCPTKAIPSAPCVGFFSDKDHQRPFVKVRRIGTGFLYTTRFVYEGIAKTLPTCATRWGHFAPYFLPFVHDGEYIGEDFAFCQRAVDAGFVIHCDTTIRLRHYGRYAFTWQPSP